MKSSEVQIVYMFRAKWMENFGEWNEKHGPWRNSQKAAEEDLKQLIADVVNGVRTWVPLNAENLYVEKRLMADPIQLKHLNDDDNDDETASEEEITIKLDDDENEISW